MQSSKLSNRFIQYLQCILTKERMERKSFGVRFYWEVLSNDCKCFSLAPSTSIFDSDSDAELERFFCFLKRSYIT